MDLSSDISRELCCPAKQHLKRMSCDHPDEKNRIEQYKFVVDWAPIVERGVSRREIWAPSQEPKGDK